MTDPTQAAERLALSVWDLIGDQSHDPASVTEDRKAEIRTGAFQFSRTVKSSDNWRVTVGRQLAAAVIAWVNNETAENYRALERKSRQYEQLRLSTK